MGGSFVFAVINLYAREVSKTLPFRSNDFLSVSVCHNFIRYKKFKNGTAFWCTLALIK